MTAQTSFWPTQSNFHGLPSAASPPEATKLLHDSPSRNAYANESRSREDFKLPGQLWLAELGRPHTRDLYPIFSNSLDVVNTGVGLAYRLKWGLNEEQILLYDSPHTHYTEPLGIYPIVDGKVQLSKIYALKGKGRDRKSPLGVASERDEAVAARQLADMAGSRIAPAVRYAYTAFFSGAMVLAVNYLLVREHAGAKSPMPIPPMKGWAP